MMEYEGHGRPWERRELASARAPLHGERGVMRIATCPLCLRENRETGGPKTRR